MAQYDTGYPADAVEFCPHPDHQDILVCGTYKLFGSDDSITSAEQDSTAKLQRRIGKCLLMRASQGHNSESLTLLQELEMSAILDMKWSAADSILAIAESEGRICLYRLMLDDSLEKTQTVQCRPSDILCLSLDWSNRRDRGPGSVIVSCSDGSLSLLGPQADGALEEVRSWHAHDYEPWIAAWDYWNTNVVYSGGDDMKLKAWDIRQEVISAIFTNRRFDAGVTTIQCHPHAEHIIAVGSYDSKVRVFDVRKPHAPLTTADVGGGAWRVKWHPSETRQSDLLVACMHDGFKVVRFSPSLINCHNVRTPGPTEDTQEWEIITRFGKHASLAYGVDWSYTNNPGKNGSLIASCSFYDHSLHTWIG